MERIYMDYAATTYVDPEVKKEIDSYFTERFGNPGSFNYFGLEAKNAVNDARNRIAKILNADSDEVIFTGSGTESINLAIKGVARALKTKGNHIITQKTEHHAVIDTCKYLESNEGFEVTYLNVDKYGLINLDELKKVINKRTILISIMHANNEIGTVQPIKEIVKIAKKNNVIFHTDACQAAGYLELDVKRLGVDMMTINGSKLYAPKGIGLLYLKKGVPIEPILHGGGQEFGLRSGTENVPGIIGLAKAIEISERIKKTECKRLSKLRDMLINGLQGKIKNVMLNGHTKTRLPNNANLSFLGVEGESLLLHLNEEGICAATGSACTSRNLEASHVLLATGLKTEAAHGSIRFTLGRKTKEEDIKKVIRVMPKMVETLRMLSPIHVD
ncbi:IscS subfamily cysteine desulfurase [Candidatus Woesearchaeota archaeon]|nr:IscS subfamily cysteine desulfurase [Candidatus Woesearchaeota archaeon]